MREETRTAEPSLDEILSTFDPKETSPKSRLTGGTSITLWVSPEDKERFNQLQLKTNRRFGKKARELLLAAMEIAEARAS